MIQLLYFLFFLGLSFSSWAEPEPAVIGQESLAQSTVAALEKSDSNEDEINIRMKSSSHMGDFLNNKLPIFGHNLFGKQCLTLHQARFFNPEYRITVGDEINIQIWGAYQLTQKLTVDTQGNIFIPEVGPIKVDGIENQKLNHIIQQHVKKTFKKGVNIYADLVTAQPVQVYVTGYVNSPGLYDGLSSDSIIHFLCAGGGINLQEGSFRDIKIIRNGKEIYSIDLYDFLLKGNINTFQLHQGDTIVVKQQKHIISVAGDIKNPYQYELLAPEISLTALMKLVNVEPTATYVRIQRNQGTKPSFTYQEIYKSKPIQLKAGDQITFIADKEVGQTIITVKGQVKGQHQYIFKQGMTLGAFVKTLHFTPEANLNNLQLFRASTAKQQKEALNTSLSRLRRQAMTGETLTGDDAKLQATRSELISKFIDEAKQIDTKGQIALGNQANWDNVILENNDVINIPAKTSVLTVSGDVVNSISLTLNPNYRVIDYIKAAGGFQSTANQGQFLIVKENGEVQTLSGSSLYSKIKFEGGDQIIILPKETESGLKVTGMMSSILYQLAIAAKVAMVV